MKKGGATGEARPTVDRKVRSAVFRGEVTRLSRIRLKLALRAI